MDKSGFSLIELLVTIAILGIIASMAVAQYSSFKEKSYDAQAIAAVKNVDTALEAMISFSGMTYSYTYGVSGCHGYSDSDGSNSTAYAGCDASAYGFQGQRGVYTYFGFYGFNKYAYSTHCLGSGGPSRMKFFEIVNGRMRSFYRTATRTSTEYCYGFQYS